MAQYLTVPDYHTEGMIRADCAAAGIRPEALEDVVMRFRDKQFTYAELPDKIAEWKNTPGHHFFSATQANVQAEALAAFGPNYSIDAQGKFVRKYGEAKAREVASEFGTALGGPAGKAPKYYTAAHSESVADLPKGSKNPWSAEAWNTTEQGRLIRVLGEGKAAGIARAAGSFIGATSRKSKPLTSRYGRN